MLLLRIAVGAGLYGAVLGSWQGLRLATFVAIKLPLLFILTALATTAFQTVVAHALGLRLPAGGTLRLSLRGYASVAALLGALAPVAALFVHTAPPPESGGRTAHNLLYLGHVGLIAGCGLVGLLAVRRSLAAAAPHRRAARTALLAWLLSSALVGGQLGWLLRPFVGSVYEPVAFLRDDAFSRNAYEFIWTDILPHLLDTRPGDRP